MLSELFVTLARASDLVPMLRLDDRVGFVVEDMTDVDQFAADRRGAPSRRRLRRRRPRSRRRASANRTPAETLPEIVAAGRSPLLGQGRRTG